MNSNDRGNTSLGAPEAENEMEEGGRPVRLKHPLSRPRGGLSWNDKMASVRGAVQTVFRLRECRVLKVNDSLGGCVAC
jgi:hypothetical protein